MSRASTCGLITFIVISIILLGGCCFFAYESGLQAADPADFNVLKLITVLLNSNAFLSGAIFLGGIFIIASIGLTQSPHAD
ncbi:hypothetical protein PAPYR_4060 [Paratrimastix pyriformis]|uniref:Uncharacterized protein n=1 Tax=Paratrimastix pyriformis TaxID=342808 RepID=A0ABQ8UND2_9EUKA|nr:hypothetical protein PAPYR_4060 [Paratrimastix pyriformis]